MILDDPYVPEVPTKEKKEKYDHKVYLIKYTNQLIIFLNEVHNYSYHLLLYFLKMAKGKYRKAYFLKVTQTVIKV